MMEVQTNVSGTQICAQKVSNCLIMSRCSLVGEIKTESFLYLIAPMLLQRMII